MKRVIVLLAILWQFSIANCQTNPEFPILKGPYLGQKPPGIKPEIFSPGIVTTDSYNHCTVCISSDGSEIYWAMVPKILFSKMVNNIWTRPENISFTQTEDGDCPVLSPDVKKMFFNSNRPITQGGTRRERIWCVEKTSKGWGEPFCLSPEINGEHLHWQISVDAVGNLFFGSERNGSKGRDDVFLAERLKDSYRRPISLGPEINTEAHEGVPFVAPDAQYLIFGRDGL